jgi:hypothetical protein
MVCPFAIRLFFAVIPAAVGAALPVPVKIKVLIGGAVDHAVFAAIRIVLIAEAGKFAALILKFVIPVGMTNAGSTSVSSELRNGSETKFGYFAPILGKIPKIRALPMGKNCDSVIEELAKNNAASTNKLFILKNVPCVGTKK